MTAKVARYAHNDAKLADRNLRFLKNLMSNTGWSSLNSMNQNIIRNMIPKTVNITPNVSFNMVNPYMNNTIPIP